MSLSRSGSSSKVEPESWFDMATERFDGVLEQLTGSNPVKSSPWHVSFQAPSLKKQVGPSGTISDNQQLFDLKFVDAIDDDLVNGIDESPTFSEVRRHRHSTGSGKRRSRRVITRDLSIPQPLFEEPAHSLSDNEFRLIYGRSREHFSASEPNLSDVRSLGDVERRSVRLDEISYASTLSVRSEGDMVESTRSI